MTKILVWVSLLGFVASVATSCVRAIQFERRETQLTIELHKVRGQFSEYREEAERLRAQGEEAARKREGELQHAAFQAQEQAAGLRERMDADRASAGVAAQRLRDAAATAALVASSSCSASTTAAVGQARRDAAGVLADVLGRADAAAGRMAAHADRSRAAGHLAEMMYDAAVSPVR